jgi:predicted ATPase
MLDRVYVDNFRSLVNFECRFKPLQLLLGPNGGGKSTVFDALALVRDFSVLGLQPDPALAGFSRTRWQAVPEQVFEIDASGNGGAYTFRLVVDSWGMPERARVVKEEVFFDGKPIFKFSNGEVHLFNDRHEDKVQYPFDWHRSALATVTERPENTKLSWFKRWLGRFLFLSPDPHQMGVVAQGEASAPTKNLSNLAAWYRHLRLENDDHELAEDLRQAIPGFLSMDLKDAGMGNRFLMVNFRVIDEPSGANRTYSHTFAELSDGQRALIGLYVALHFAFKPDTTLFFDEPDNFIALREIQPWLDRVVERVEDDESNTQVLIASHHPELLNRLALAGGIVLSRPEGRHTRRQDFGDTAETGLSPAELIARGWDQ